MTRKGSLWYKMYGASQQIPPPYINLEDRKEVHITDLSAFVLCRWMWEWGSPLRHSLQPAVLSKPLSTGQGIHIGLNAGYPLGPANFNAPKAVAAFTGWLKKREKQVIEYTGPLWQHEKEQFSSIKNLGQAMLLHYGLWVKSTRMPLDRSYEILATEKIFKLPIPGTRDLAYAGRFDGLVRENNSGKLYILEFKTARSLKGVERIFRGMQPIAYLWAAKQLYGPNVAGVLYRVLLKKVPDNPRPLSHGGFSRAKTIKSTPEWYKHCLNVMADYDGEPRKHYREQAQPTLRMLGGRENGFFLQHKLRRSSKQLEHTLTVLKELGVQMANRRTLTFPVDGIHCSWCQFKDPCDLRIRGHDEACEALLEAEYAKRDYWERVQNG